MEMDIYNNDLPVVETGEEYYLKNIWDGNGEAPDSSYSYTLTDMDWINYVFDIIEENEENPLKTIIRITGIELL